MVVFLWYKSTVAAISGSRDPVTHLARLKSPLHLPWQKYQSRRPTMTIATPATISPTNRDVTSTRVGRLSLSVDHHKPHKRCDRTALSLSDKVSGLYNVIKDAIWVIHNFFFRSHLIIVWLLYGNRLTMSRSIPYSVLKTKQWKVAEILFDPQL